MCNLNIWFQFVNICIPSKICRGGGRGVWEDLGMDENIYLYIFRKYICNYLVILNCVNIISQKITVSISIDTQHTEDIFFQNTAYITLHSYHYTRQSVHSKKNTWCTVNLTLHPTSSVPIPLTAYIPYRNTFTLIMWWNNQLSCF